MRCAEEARLRTPRLAKPAHNCGMIRKSTGAAGGQMANADIEHLSGFVRSDQVQGEMQA